MITRRSYKFLLKVTKKQARALRLVLEECRWLYNAFLEQRILAYQELDIQLTKYDQLMMLPEMKVDRPSLGLVHSQILQNVGDRLDKAFQNFFRRVKHGETPGFPRFRGMFRYSSFCFPQSGFSFTGNLLKLSKIGCIRVKMHREILGEIKTCTLIQNASGSWHVAFSCEVNVSPLPETDQAIGIDVGLENFAIMTDGQIIPNPRFYKKSEKG